MFESLFKYPTVLARHVEGPAADERQRFLLHRANEGAALGTLLRIARELLVIAKNISVTAGRIPRRISLVFAFWASLFRGSNAPPVSVMAPAINERRLRPRT
jgi:hypothetical protein